MLQQWQWGAQGKHPVVNDYVTLGQSFPLIKIFSDWVKNGYQIVASKTIPSSHPCSWRFWTKGAKKDALVCGLLKDSGDRVGRPYPLLLMGTGPLQGWQERWDLLISACEKSWGQMEYVCSKMVRDLKHLEDEIYRMPHPVPQWPEFLEERKKLLEERKKLKELSFGLDKSALTSDIADRSLSDKGEIFICLNQEHDYFTLVSLWHFFLKDHLAGIPNAVFIGGTFEKLYLAVFKRPLLPNDFVRLWSST